MTHIDREQKVQRAQALFMQGYNCAQSVAAAFSEETGLEQAVLARLASGFGGGVGGLRGLCGAVSGMVLVYDLCKGYSDPAEAQHKLDTYAAVKRMIQRFEAMEGDVHCRALLERAGVEIAPPVAKRTPAYYDKRPCPRLVAECAGILADALNGDADAQA